MYSDVELKMITPRMSIDYRTQAGILHSGTFDNILENAFGARITTIFPLVNAKGEFSLSSDYFDLFIGEVFEVKDLLNRIDKPLENGNTVITANDIEHLKNIIEYENSVIEKVVLTKGGLRPLKYGDAAFSTHEEMAQAIAKINQTFNSVKISVQNQELPTKHR